MTICRRYNFFAYLAMKSTIDAKYLQCDLDKLTIWEGKLKTAFYLHKCNILSVARNKAPIKFNHILHGHPLESLEEVKYLHLTIRQDFKWKSHINNVCMKTNKTLGNKHINV